jgi:Flp pilus assembly protein TadG
MRKWSLIGGLAPRKSAQALIEFALILPVMLVMLLGGLDLGRALVYGVAVQDGAREAARLGANGSAGDAPVLRRLIDASAPALTGCAVSWATQSCGGGTWTFTMQIVAPNGTYPSLFQANAGCQLPACALAGSQLTVTASGKVSMFQGITAWGLTLFQIGAQGQASMVML